MKTYLGLGIILLAFASMQIGCAAKDRMDSRVKEVKSGDAKTVPNTTPLEAEAEAAIKSAQRSEAEKTDPNRVVAPAGNKIPQVTAEGANKSAAKAETVVAVDQNLKCNIANDKELKQEPILLNSFLKSKTNTAKLSIPNSNYEIKMESINTSKTQTPKFGTMVFSISGSNEKSALSQSIINYDSNNHYELSYNSKIKVICEYDKSKSGDICSVLMNKKEILTQVITVDPHSWMNKDFDSLNVEIKSQSGVSQILIKDNQLSKAAQLTYDVSASRQNPKIQHSVGEASGAAMAIACETR